MKFNAKTNIKNIFKKSGKKNKDVNSEAPDNENVDGDIDSRFFSKVKTKVGDMFNYEPQKERVLNQEDFKAAGDVYYASVSALYKVAQRLLVLILIIFLIFSLITNYREITYNNFFYLLRDFSAAADSQASDYQVLSYDSNARQKFALYRGGLVSAAPSTVSLFTAGGRRTLKNNNEYYSPNVVCCDKYVLVYDSASSAFSVYNSFSKIYNETLEEGNVITNACFDDDGAMAISTRMNNSKTFVYLYNKDLKLRGKISDNKFILDMSFDSSNDRFAAVYYEEGLGVGQTTVCVYDIRSSDSAAIVEEIVLEGDFPLSCSYLDDGNLALITNHSICVYNKKLKLTQSYDFEEAAISAFNSNEHGAAVVVNGGILKTVIAFDKKGDLLYNNNIGDNVSDICVYDGFLFLKNVSGVTRIDCKNQSSEFLPCENGEMLIYSEDTAISCGEAKAEYLVFGKRR